MDEKTCKKCLRVLPAGSFPRHSQMADGRLSTCRECKAEYQKAHYQANKEHHAETGRAWREANRDRDRDLHAAWRAANPDRWKEIQRRAQENAKRSGTAARSAATRRQREAEARDGVVSLKSILLKHGMHCSICGKPIEHKYQLTFDHVIPIARGGKHTDENIRPAHRSCNSWKCGRTTEEIAGLTPPEPGETDEWDLRRAQRAAQLKSEKITAWYADPANAEKIAERNRKIAKTRKGYVNPPESRKGPKGRKIPADEAARRAESVRATYATWTPEQRAEHAAKISASKQGSLGNVANLAKGWSPEVHAMAVAAAAEANRSKPQSAESNAKRSESLRRAYAEGRHSRGHAEETKRKISETKRTKSRSDSDQ